MSERWRRAAYATAGWLFVALAALGVALPLLPTTPFVLLASSCFVRSSPRARLWLLHSRVFGPTLRDWDAHHAVRRPVKVLAFVVVVAVLGLTFLRDMHPAMRGAILAVGAVGLIVVWWLPVMKAPQDETT
jgi:uncharacterized membrane protein YbaN (DUF454 family)